MTTTVTAMTGKDVVALDDAAVLGSVGHVVLGQQPPILVALVLGKGRKARYVPRAEIKGFTGDVITVTKSSSARETADVTEAGAVKAGSIIGRRLLTTAGFEHGTVDDIEIDDGGVATTLKSSEGDIDGTSIRGIGSYAVIIDAAAPS